MFIFFILITPLFAQDIYEFENFEQEQIFQTLTYELRCPKCQNSNIDQSDALIAKDLKDKTYELVLSGMNVEEVKDYMYQRYGDFVLYNPRDNLLLILLKYLPLISLTLFFVILSIFYLRKKL